MNVSKERLLEIEKELNGLSIASLTSISNGKRLQHNKAGLFSISKQELSERARATIFRRLSEGEEIWGSKSYDCPNCPLSGRGQAFKSNHFDNCKMKGVNLDDLYKDLVNLTTIDICTKYGIGKTSCKRYREHFGISDNFTCSHCNISGKGLYFKREHFDNCRLKGVNLDEFNKDIVNLSVKEIYLKYGCDWGFKGRYMNYHNISYTNNKQHCNRIDEHCPHCNRIGKGLNFIREHFDNCKLKGINLDEFNKDISIISKNKMIIKYDLTTSFLNKYIKYHNIKKPHWKLIVLK